MPGPSRLRWRRLLFGRNAPSSRCRPASMCITAMAPQPSTRRRHRAHLVFPYLLRHRAATRPNAVWPPGDLQCGLGRAICRRGVHRPAPRSRHADPPGWPGLLARHHLRRATLALAHLQGGLPPRIRLGRNGRHRTLPHPLQHPPSAIEPRRSNPGRGILHEPPLAAAAGGGKTRPPIHLSQTQNLFR